MAEEKQVTRTESDSPYVGRFASFFEQSYKKQIEKLVGQYPQKRSLEIDIRELEHFDFELADELLEHPDDVLEAAAQAILSVDVPALGVDDFRPHIRVFNLPEDFQPELRNIGSHHIGKLISVEGVAVQITDVLPKLRIAVWECKRCGNTYRLIQSATSQEQPTICECKHHDFSLKSADSTFEDYQKIRIQEPLEVVKGNQQPTNVDIYVSDDIVNRVTPGDKIKITGILRLVPPKEKKLVYGRYVQAVHIEETEKEFSEIEISKEDEEEIRKLAKDPQIYEKLIKSIAPNIYGHELVKESIALQLFGGVKKFLPGHNNIRGNIHVLLVGEPGMAKSAILQAVNHIAPKSIYTAGKTTSAAGLSASAVKDEFGEGGWTLKAGTLVLASGGMALIDELDKMDAEDRSALHEAMEQESYHKDFEIDLLGLPKEKIGNFVERLLEENTQYVVEGHKTLFLDTKGMGLKILTTDFSKIYEKEITQVSKHIAEKDFFEITFQDSRTIKVTENHPFFVLRDGKITVIPSNELTDTDCIPCTTSNTNQGKSLTLQFVKIKKTRKIERKEEQWVYDIGIEPEHCFISNNLVLHNSISVSKAGIIARFKSETSILSAANPKYSRFDMYQNFMEQINLPPTLVSRFDLFFLIRDVLDRKKDQEISTHILRTHQAGEILLQEAKQKKTQKSREVSEMEKIITPAISAEVLKKYVSFARQNIFPILSQDSMDAISEFYVDLRDQGRKQGTYAATHRQLEALVRLSEASAKIRLSNSVDIEDAQRAMRLFRAALQDLVVDPETGKIDFDIINTGRTQTELTHMKKVLQIIKDKSADVDMVPIEEVIAEAKTQGIEEEKTKEIITKLEKAGDIYKPKYKFVKPTTPSQKEQ